jgi:hypothetical protein
MDHKQYTSDANGVQYIFAIMEEDEYSIFRWKFMRHIFQLNNVAPISGDFITSMWFSKEKPLNIAQEFLVVGIKGSIDYNQITSLVNGAVASRNNNRLTKLEKMQKIVFKDHFILSSEEIIKFTDNHTITEGGNISMLGENYDSTLEFHARNFGKTIYITLPSFYKA